MSELADPGQPSQGAVGVTASNLAPHAATTPKVTPSEVVDAMPAAEVERPPISADNMTTILTFLQVECDQRTLLALDEVVIRVGLSNDEQRRLLDSVIAAAADGS